MMVFTKEVWEVNVLKLVQMKYTTKSKKKKFTIQTNVFVNASIICPCPGIMMSRKLKWSFFSIPKKTKKKSYNKLTCLCFLWLLIAIFGVLVYFV